MSGIFFRMILAVVAVVLLFVLVPVLFRVFGLPLSADVWMILKICIGAIALFYIAWGRTQPPV